MPKRPRDMNQLAKAIVAISTGEAADEISPKKRVGSPRGTAGGLKGGPARASALGRERRVEIAKTAAAVRWRRRD